MIISVPPSPPDASPSELESQRRELEHILNETLALYPNIPSLGSPFGTGNMTFGLDPEYKRTAAVCEYTIFLINQFYVYFP
jgi:acetylcholinesterase